MLGRNMASLIHVGCEMYFGITSALSIFAPHPPRCRACPNWQKHEHEDFLKSPDATGYSY